MNLQQQRRSMYEQWLVDHSDIIDKIVGEIVNIVGHPPENISVVLHDEKLVYWMDGMLFDWYESTTGINCSVEVLLTGSGGWHTLTKNTFMHAQTYANPTESVALLSEVAMILRWLYDLGLTEVVRVSGQTLAEDIAKMHNDGILLSTER